MTHEQKTLGSTKGKERQIALAAWVENPHLTEREMAGIAGVTDRTVYRWRRDPEFVEPLIKAARQNFFSNLPALYDVALKKALDGNLGWMKLVIDHIEVIEGMRQEYERENVFIVSWGTQDLAPTQRSLTGDVREA